MIVAQKKEMLPTRKSSNERIREHCIHRLFERQVEQNPATVAVTFERNRISYGELNARSNRIAHALLKLDLMVNQPVAILLENGPQQIEALFGVLKAGCVFVCLDPGYPANRMVTILEECKPPVLISESTCLDRQTELLQGLAKSDMNLLMVDGKDSAAEGNGFSGTFYGSDFLATCSDQNPEVDVAPRHPAYIVYTSGSTGRPKGIVQSHRSFSQFIMWQSRQFDIVAPQRWAQWASIGYDASYCEVFGTLCFGATLCMAKSSVRYDPPALIEWAKEEQITILQFVPSFGGQVIEILKSENQNNAHHPLPDLELLLLAGEPLPVDLASTWLNGFPNPPKLFNLYGPSESVLATYYPVEEIKPDQRSVPIGRAIDGREILILDEQNQPCACGVKGELYIRSQYLTMGYFQCLEETEKKFIQNPLHNDYPDPVYRTGDFGRWLADGNIEFGGRVDNMVKIRGLRIELGEIEFVVSQHRAVREAIVLARQDVPDKQQLIAYLVPANGEKLVISELRSFVRARLPEFMVPSVFMVLDALPVNENGKVDRSSLPAPDKTRPPAETFVAPRDDLELKLTQIWEEVLGIRPVGIKDNFFDLGGQSLLAVQLFTQVRKEFNQNLPLATLFEASTIELLAAILRDGKRPTSSLLVPLQPRGSKRPLFCVPGLGGDPIVFRQLALHFDVDRPFYGLRSQGLDGLQAPLIRLEDIAAGFIKEIQMVQSVGPYALAGYSFGCEVVYEMARQLNAQGQKVALLAMLNYFLGKFQISPPNLRQKLACHVNLFSGLTVEQKLTHFRNLIFERLIRRKLFKKLCNFYLEQGRPLPGILGYIGRVILVNFVAALEYAPQAYSGRVTLFRAEGVDHDPELGLPGLAAQGVELHYIRGNNVSMLKEPYAQDLAKKLSECLDKVELET